MDNMEDTFQSGIVYRNSSNLNGLSLSSILDQGVGVSYMEGKDQQLLILNEPNSVNGSQITHSFVNSFPTTVIPLSVPVTTLLDSKSTGQLILPQVTGHSLRSITSTADEASLLCHSDISSESDCPDFLTKYLTECTTSKAAPNFSSVYSLLSRNDLNKQLVQVDHAAHHDVMSVSPTPDHPEISNKYTLGDSHKKGDFSRRSDVYNDNLPEMHNKLTGFPSSVSRASHQVSAFEHSNSINTSGSTNLANDGYQKAGSFSLPRKFLSTSIPLSKGLHMPQYMPPTHKIIDGDDLVCPKKETSFTYNSSRGPTSNVSLSPIDSSLLTSFFTEEGSNYLSESPDGVGGDCDPLVPRGNLMFGVGKDVYLDDNSCFTHNSDNDFLLNNFYCSDDEELSFGVSCTDGEDLSSVTNPYASTISSEGLSPQELSNYCSGSFRLPCSQPDNAVSSSRSFSVQSNHCLPNSNDLTLSISEMLDNSNVDGVCHLQDSEGSMPANIPILPCVKRELTGLDDQLLLVHPSGAFKESKVRQFAESTPASQLKQEHLDCGAVSSRTHIPQTKQLKVITAGHSSTVVDKPKLTLPGSTIQRENCKLKENVPKLSQTSSISEGNIISHMKMVKRIKQEYEDTDVGEPPPNRKINQRHCRSSSTESSDILQERNAIVKDSSLKAEGSGKSVLSANGVLHTEKDVTEKDTSQNIRDGNAQTNAEDAEVLSSESEQVGREAEPRLISFKGTPEANNSSDKEDPKMVVKLINMKRKSKLATSVGIRCDIDGCYLKLRSEELIGYHRKCHQGAKLACPECNTVFIYWRQIAEHLWKAHERDVGLHKCDKCDYKCYSHRRLMSSHYQVHSNERPYPCSKCNKEFKTLKCYRAHDSIMHKRKERKLVCKFCDRTFHEKRMLTNHMEAVHNKVKPFLCNYCGKAFASKFSLNLHLRIHTGEKPFSCEICSYRTSDHNSFRRHKMQHTQDKRYKCIYCPYSSIQSSTYKCHLNENHREKAVLDGLLFLCDMCKFNSVKKDNFLAHISSHYSKCDAVSTTEASAEGGKSGTSQSTASACSS